MWLYTNWCNFEQKDHCIWLWDCLLAPGGAQEWSDAGMTLWYFIRKSKATLLLQLLSVHLKKPCLQLAGSRSFIFHCLLFKCQAPDKHVMEVNLRGEEKCLWAPTRRQMWFFFALWLSDHVICVHALIESATNPQTSGKHGQQTGTLIKKKGGTVVTDMSGSLK